MAGRGAARRAGSEAAGERGLPTRDDAPAGPPVYPTLAPGGVELRLELLGDGQPVARASPPLPAPETDGRIAWIGGLPAKSLAAGRYEVVATVRQAGEAVEERTAFEIGVDAAAESTPDVPPRVPADLVPVLEQAARYVLDYEQALHDLAAEESYTQWAQWQDPVAGPSLTCTATACRRRTRADVVFVRLGGAIPWGTFRDVFEVDGQEVRHRDARLESLLSASSVASVAQHVRAILDESARYNIGPAVRNINFPTPSLAFLLPRNQPRFAWKRGGSRRFETVEGVELLFDEVARPTLVDQGGHGDLPARAASGSTPRAAPSCAARRSSASSPPGRAPRWPPSTGPCRSSPCGSRRRCGKGTKTSPGLPCPSSAPPARRPPATRASGGSP